MSDSNWIESTRNGFDEETKTKTAIEWLDKHDPFMYYFSKGDTNDSYWEETYNSEIIDDVYAICRIYLSHKPNEVHIPIKWHVWKEKYKKDTSGPVLPEMTIELEKWSMKPKPNSETKVNISEMEYIGTEEDIAAKADRIKEKIDLALKINAVQEILASVKFNKSN